MHKVLITKELTKEQQALAHDYKLDVTVQPFIKITFKYDTVPVPKAEAWIVTSANAAKYIESHISEIPKENYPEQIFAIGKATANHLDHLSIPVKMPSYGIAENVVELVVDSNVDSAVFFSGNLRSDVVPNGLKDYLDFTEFQVYKTELLDVKLDMDKFEGIAFFSPSGVQGFAKSNSITNQKVVAIGTVTKKTVQELLGVRPGIPGNPTVEDVLFALKEDLEA